MTTLGHSFTITGEITTDEDLVIEGRVSGHVLARNVTLTVGSKAQLENAELRGARIRVLGAVTGSLMASERIELAASAKVSGALSANQVVIADGAVFNGGIDMDRRTITAKMANYKAAQIA